MCDQCNEMRGELKDLTEKLFTEMKLGGLFEGQKHVLEKQVVSQQTLINNLLDMIKKEK